MNVCATLDQKPSTGFSFPRLTRLERMSSVNFTRRLFSVAKAKTSLMGPSFSREPDFGGDEVITVRTSDRSGWDAPTGDNAVQVGSWECHTV